MPRPSHMITFEGTTKSVADWSRLTGLSAGLIAKRLNAGWSVENALTAPLDSRGRKRKPKVKQGKATLAASLPALADYQRDTHAAHRRLTRTVRAFIRDIEQQIADLRHDADQLLAAQHNDAEPPVVDDFLPNASDRMSPSAQERT